MSQLFASGGQSTGASTLARVLPMNSGLSGYEFEQTVGDSGGQRSLTCYSPWDGRVRHDLVTEQQ